jgi:L-histidine N-alpha-methyltransferase
VELGSGSSVKTDYLLSAYQNLYSNLCYTPIDISASALQLAGRQIIKKRPAVQVVGIHGTYNDSFQVLPCISPALIIFLGSTLGNFTPAEEQVFWHDISASMQPGDYFLLGIDLIKEVQILEAAYNDAAGITAAFSKNYLARMNRELGCEIDMEAVDPLAYFNAGESRIEIYLEFLNHQTLYLKPTGATFFIEKGERILIEISRKFQLDEMANALRNYGFRTIQSYTDENRWFALLLLQKKEYF